MPEGDTVWRQARDLRAVLQGQELASCDFRVPGFATLDFSGQTVTSVQSRGKHLLMYVGPHVIHSHLSMEGHWDIYPRATPGRASRWRRPAFTARVVLQTQLVTAVGFSLGTLEVVAAAQVLDVLGDLGPDLLGPDWDADRALQRLLADPRRAVGLALLDQRNLAGIGNVYRNDLCFLGGVHPAMPIGEVAGLPRMVDLAKRLLEANKDRSSRSTTGGPARGEAAAWVYGLAGKPCKRCGSLIRYATLADPLFPTHGARDIYWCPHCQGSPPSSTTG